MRLAEIIVLDQFSRNLFRGAARAFEQDFAALALAQEAVSAGAHLALEPVQRVFLLLPYMHSESREIHVIAEQLFREFTPATTSTSSCGTRRSSTAWPLSAPQCGARSRLDAR